MKNRYLVVSDLHLCDVEDHSDGWRSFKSSRFLFDDAFDDLVEGFAGQACEETKLTLILNGDIFDFDLVTAVPDEPDWPVSFSERRRGLDGTEKKSVWKLERVLSQHPGLVRTLAAYLAAGHRLVYIMGNHDREFHFPGVQQAFVNALRRQALVDGQDFQDDTIRFESWFYAVPGEIYVEHGQQYDHYSSFRFLLSPVVGRRKEEVLALPMANLSNRYLMSRMGFFNPHSSDYILNFFSYFMHWLKKYAFTRRSLVFNWFWGSLVVMGKLLLTKRRLLRSRPDLNRRFQDVAERFDLDIDLVKDLHRLQATPITNRFFRIVREFWLDRMLMALLMTGGTITLALVPIPLWIKLMVPLSSFPLIYFVYEWFVQGETVFTIEKRLPQVARAVSELIDVKVVAFGHTHIPRLIPLSREVTFVDTGTWAPIMKKLGPESLAPGYRNTLQISFESGHPRIRFDSWMEHALARRGKLPYNLKVSGS